VATNSGKSLSEGVFLFLVRMVLLVVIVAIGVDYAFPKLPSDLQLDVMKFKQGVSEFLCVRRE